MSDLFVRGTLILGLAAYWFAGPGDAAIWLNALEAAAFLSLIAAGEVLLYVRALQSATRPVLPFLISLALVVTPPLAFVGEALVAPRVAPTVTLLLVGVLEIWALAHSPGFGRIVALLRGDPAEAR